MSLSKKITLGICAAFLLGPSVPLWAADQNSDTRAEEAETLGRLFTTPRQRLSLNLARRRALRAKMRGTPKAKQERSVVTLNGIVKRSNGPSAVWINGRSALTENDELPPGVSIPKTGINETGVMIRLPNTRKRALFRVGQKMDSLAGTVVEPYQTTVEEEEQARKQAEADKKKKQAAENRAPTKGNAKAQKDRLGLGSDGAVLGDMMKQRESFKNRFGALTDMFGQGKP